MASIALVVVAWVVTLLRTTSWLAAPLVHPHFSDTRANSLENYVESIVMLQYNKRKN